MRAQNVKSKKLNAGRHGIFLGFGRAVRTRLSRLTTRKGGLLLSPDIVPLPISTGEIFDISTEKIREKIHVGKNQKAAVVKDRLKSVTTFLNNLLLLLRKAIKR